MQLPPQQKARIDRLLKNPFYANLLQRQSEALVSAGEKFKPPVIFKHQLDSAPPDNNPKVQAGTKGLIMPQN